MTAIADDADRSFDYTFTVFTPTYNRAETLERAYRSLQEQTFTDFEWVVVDDGSDDDTAERVSEWQEKTSFPIQYIKQAHSGKHVAYNKGIERAAGRFFLVLDSDDILDENVLERLIELWRDSPEGRDDIVGVKALCVDQDGTVNGDPFPESPMVADNFDINYRYRCGGGDGVTFTKTTVLERYPFPEVDGVSYIPESYVWSQLAVDGYSWYCVNEVVGTVYTDEDGRADRLTQSSNLRNAPAFALWHKHRLNEHIAWFRSDPLAFVTSAAGYSMHSFATGTSLPDQFGGLDNVLARLLWLVFLPVGYLAYLHYRS